MITSDTDVLLKFSKVKEVLCGIWQSRGERAWSQKFRSSPFGEPQRKYNTGDDCLGWNRRLGVNSDGGDHMDFSRCSHSQDTMECTTLTAGANSFSSCLLVERMGKSVNESFHAELTGGSLTMVLHVNRKPPTAGVYCWKDRPSPAAEPRTVDVALGLETWIY